MEFVTQPSSTNTMMANRQCLDSRLPAHTCAIPSPILFPNCCISSLGLRATATNFFLMQFSYMYSAYAMRNAVLNGCTHFLFVMVSAVKQLWLIDITGDQC